MSSFGDKLEELDLTPDEINRLTEAMKKKEFRDLLAEYAKEIQDPENKRKYEEEIRMMESERGVDVKFITPTPGYVIKTVQNSETKCFVNICHSDIIDKASCTKSPEQKGEHWSIPYSTAAGREDIDKAGGKCVVYDCVFHPDTYQRGLKDARFKKLIHDTALQGIENQLSVKLDKVNLKFPKLKFKGMVQPTMIRRKKDDEGKNTPEVGKVDSSPGAGAKKDQQKKTAQNTAAKNDIEEKLKFPYPYDVPTNGDDTKIGSSNSVCNGNDSSCKNEKKKEAAVKLPVIDTVEYNGKTYTVPNYTIVHRGYSDMQTSVEMSDSKLHITRPKELVVQISLPLLKSAKSVSLDVFRKQLVLHSDTPAAYRLDIPLSYPVEEEKGSARFDKNKLKLIVTLPVVPPEKPSPVSIPIEDQITSSTELVQEINCQKNEDKAEYDNSYPNENSPTESLDEATRTDMVTLDELPESEQAEKYASKERSTTKVPSKPKKHNFEKESEKYFEDWPVPDLKIPPDLARQLDSIPDGWLRHSSKTSKHSKNAKTFPVDPFLYEVDIPKYKFAQRPETLSMIILEKRVRENLLEVKPFKNDDGLHIRFCAVSERDCNKWFYIYVEFDSSTKCTIDRSTITTDINEDNCVILMKKSEGSKNIWPFLKIGPCKDTLHVVYLDPEVEVHKMNKDLFENCPQLRLPMHIVEPNCTPERMTLTLEPGRDPKCEDELSEDRQHSVGKYSKTAEEISALIQSGKLDEAIAKEIAMEQEKELDDLIMSKDDVIDSTSYKKYHKKQSDEDPFNFDETLAECRNIASKQHFLEKEGIFVDERYLLNGENFDKIADSNMEETATKSKPKSSKQSKSNNNCESKDENDKTELSLNLESNTERVDCDEKPSTCQSTSKDDVHTSESSSKDTTTKGQTRSSKKKKQKKQKNVRARLLSHSSDDEQTRVNTYQNIQLTKTVPDDNDVNSNAQKPRNGSWDSSSNTSPAQSPRDQNQFGAAAVVQSGEESTDNGNYSRSIIKRACRSCAEAEDDSDGEHSGMRKSVSFCENVDVVNIKTTTTKAARSSTKKMKKRDRKKRRNANSNQSEEGGVNNSVNSDNEDGDGNEGGAKVEVKEEATWNKIPLSTVPLTFDLD